MVAPAGLWPFLSPLAGQKRPPILPGGRFLLFGVCPSLTGSGLRAPSRLSSGGKYAQASFLAGIRRYVRSSWAVGAIQL